VNPTNNTVLNYVHFHISNNQDVTIMSLFLVKLSMCVHVSACCFARYLYVVCMSERLC
jgi:hypothetical protein